MCSQGLVHRLSKIECPSGSGLKAPRLGGRPAQTFLLKQREAFVELVSEDMTDDGLLLVKITKPTSCGARKFKWFEWSLLLGFTPVPRIYLLKANLGFLSFSQQCVVSAVRNSHQASGGIVSGQNVLDFQGTSTQCWNDIQLAHVTCISYSSRGTNLLVKSYLQEPTSSDG